MYHIYKHFCGIPAPPPLLLLYTATHHGNCHNATNVPHTAKTLQKQRINCPLSLKNWKCLLLQLGKKRQGLTGDEESIVAVAVAVVPAAAAALAPCVDVDSSELSRRDLGSAFYGAARPRSPFTIKVFYVSDGMYIILQNTTYCITFFLVSSPTNNMLIVYILF